MDISPKVLIPAVGQVIVGVVLIVLGYDVEGKTAVATGLGTFLAGYTASDPQRVPKRPYGNRRELGASSVEVLLALIAVVLVAHWFGWNP